ncbi:MAG: metal-dependent transcriptional regulator [Candidatus Bathycorpusculaceae bacterium]
MATEVSYEAEEYVEAIYKLQKRGGVAKTMELADELNVVPGSVTNTIAHLEKHGLVEHEPYRGVKLTARGEKLALDIIRRHRLAEKLLTDILNAEWCDVHESACKLEHALTREVMRLLEKRLENPRFCPHGNPIPSEEGLLEEEECYPLTKMPLGETGRIAKITNEKREKLVLFASKGIKPDAPVHIVKRLHSRLVLCVSGKECTLSCEDAVNVWVKIAGRNTHAI